jgi:peptidoglycan hydrolase-like protein with peptidoglycan-binding domain
MSISISRPSTRLTLLAGTAAAALLIGWAVGVGAQTTDMQLPPIPQAKQQPQQPQQALQSEGNTASTVPAMPLGHDDVREVQNQLIALGFDPGAADGQIGPATNAAAQQYDQSRGGNGQVAIDSTLLARLKADKGSRLTYEQVQERSQAHQQASAPAAASNQFGGIVQQFMPLIGAAIANSNANNNGYYGPGSAYYGPGPGYYGPPGRYW